MRSLLYFMLELKAHLSYLWSWLHFVHLFMYYVAICMEKPSTLIGVFNAMLRTSGLCFHPTSVSVLILILLNSVENLRTIGLRLGIFYFVQWNPFIGTSVGTEGSGPIRGVVLVKGWSKMAPRTRWVNTKYRGNLYIHDSSIYYSLR